MSTQTNINKVFWKRKLYPINLVLFLIFPHQNYNSIAINSFLWLSWNFATTSGFYSAETSNMAAVQRATNIKLFMVILSLFAISKEEFYPHSADHLEFKRRKMLQDLKVGLWNYEGLKLIQGSRKIMMIVIVISKLSINGSLCGRI